MKKAKAMGKRRMIYGSLSTSRKFNSQLVSDKARLLYYMMYPHSDDFGRMEAEPSAIKMTAVPGLDWSFKDIETCLSELLTELLIEIYEVDGKKYLQIVDFEKHQTFARERVENTPAPIQQLKCSKSDDFQLKVKVSKVKESKENIGKDQYLEFVFLTKEEHFKLIDRFGVGKTKEMIERLNNYGHQKPKKFKEYASHYHTILSWANKDQSRPSTDPFERLPKGQ